MSQELIERLRSEATTFEPCSFAQTMLLEAADVVPRSAYEQVRWERDLAIQQLKEDYGVEFGEKKKDVAPVRHGRWVTCRGGKDRQCSECNWSTDFNIPRNYCPNCGAKMDLEESL